ncbi:MAG: hypothetical protein AAB038_02905 [Planctomycetota bacterium]
MVEFVLILVIIAILFFVFITAPPKSDEELKAHKEKLSKASKETLVTVGKYIHLIDAQAAWMRFESEDIESYLQDEIIVLFDPFYSPAVGGVSIQVKSSDVARALEVLAMKPEITEEPVEKYEGTGDPCPKCGSYNIYPYRDVSGILTFVVSLIFYFIAPFPGKKRMHCFDCKHRWKMP